MYRLLGPVFGILGRRRNRAELRRRKRLLEDKTWRPGSPTRPSSEHGRIAAHSHLKNFTAAADAATTLASRYARFARDVGSSTGHMDGCHTMSNVLPPIEVGVGSSARDFRLFSWIAARVTVQEEASAMGSRTLRLLLVTAWSFLVVLVLAGCVPVEPGPPDLSEVEAHLGLIVGYVPEGCDPVGLDGDGRGTYFGAAFACPEDATLRIERLASERVEGQLPALPEESVPGRVEWRDPSTGDEIRVRSDEFATDVLLSVARAISLPD